MDSKQLNNGVHIPMVGLGVYNISLHDTQHVVEDALSVGYRSIDTAAMYRNERGVGNAIRSAGVSREDIFVTTKICEPCYTARQTLNAVVESMHALQLDYVDLMLLHWPVGNPAVMWQALEELYKQGLFRAIGVSNFYPHTFSQIVGAGKVMPVVNQCEAHVLYQQRAMQSYLQSYDVALEAWSPLAEGRNTIVQHPTLTRVAQQHGKTAAQVALKFLVQQGIIVIPKTTHIERMRENIHLFDFQLTDEEMQLIRQLDTGHNITGWPADALTYEV